ncbi:hypothetical protein [Streptomyces griseofuscus]|nr:hypothetical protein [Streptomyces griseofuscus]
MSAINWGDVPTWLGTIFAAAAAGAAVWTLKSQRDQIGEQRSFIAEQSANLQLERQQLMAELHDRRSTQARRVRLIRTAGGAELDPETGQLAGADHWTVIVRNDSDAPVYDLTMTFAGEPARWVETNERTGGGAVAVLGRGQQAVFTSPFFVDTLLMRARPVTRFRDAEGVWWQLLHDEQLTETSPPAQGEA